MDKFQLLQVLKNGTAFSDDAALAVIDLKRQFPFSQVVHVIAARISKDKALPDQQAHLQQAAVYIGDRSILKEVMLREITQTPQRSEEMIEAVRENSHAIADQPSESFVATAAITEATLEKTEIGEKEDNVAIPVAVLDDATTQTEKTADAALRDAETENIINTIDFADVVVEDLRRLSELKHNFEMLFLEHSAKMASEEKSNEQIVETKSKREKIIELAKAVNSHSEVETPSKGRKRRKDAHADLIEEIQTTKEEIVPENERQKEQIEIIDHFIKAQPTINSKDRIPTPAADLNSIKSGEFGENIVSETLVEILIKQGKKERAIEVLKKLIWKYPQKKAYFASQIEDLKK